MFLFVLFKYIKGITVVWVCGEANFHSPHINNNDGTL